MDRRRRMIVWLVLPLLILGLLVTGAGIAGLVVLSSRLPSVEALKDVRYQQPLRVFSAEGDLIAEFGDYRRMPLPYDAIPALMKAAFIAAEDERFFEHPGVDWKGMARAVLHLARHRSIGPGGSTITMQTARNFFLGREQTYLRKLNEILLSFKIESELDKAGILELYLNKIYLGQRAYGVGAASQIYYGRPPDQLTVAETAMIAGLPKAPSAINPIRSPERALQRRGYVLRRMLETGAIDQTTYDEAMAQPLTASLQRPTIALDAPYVAEVARAQAVTLFGEEAYTEGYRVHTTVRSGLQRAAEAAIVGNLIDFDERQGYRGPLASHASLSGTIAGDVSLLDAHPTIAGMPAALVLALTPADTGVTGSAGVPMEPRAAPAAGFARLLFADSTTRDLPLERLQWGGSDRVPVSAGDVVRLRADGDSWRLAQMPEVQGAMVAVTPGDGAIVAMVGGFDFRSGQFNRATQAQRQPGSAFKPFIFSAALEQGYTLATMVNDAPVVFDDPALETTWRPENYTGRFYGPTRFREALVHSRNLAAIRILRDIGIGPATGFLPRFGFPDAAIPRNLSLALGSGVVSPLDLAIGYSVFANGGYRVMPWLVSHIEDTRGDRVFTEAPARVCDTPCAAASDQQLPVYYQTADRVLPAENAYLVTSMLQDVIRNGTGRRAQVLGRDAIAGKTGTTNEGNDAWFAGYTTDLVATVWVGYDQVRSLGRGETGSRTALPVWIDFMAAALAGFPEKPFPRPPGLVTARIDPGTGQLTGVDNPDALFEIFREGQVAEGRSDRGNPIFPGDGTETDPTITRDLF